MNVPIPVECPRCKGPMDVTLSELDRPLATLTVRCMKCRASGSAPIDSAEAKKATSRRVTESSLATFLEAVRDARAKADISQA